MIDSGLEYLRGESTLNLDDPAWDLTPGGSFLNSNTAGITGELGLLEPLFFDPQGFLMHDMKDEPSPDSNHQNISSEVEQYSTQSSAQLEANMNEQQAVLSEPGVAHSNPETPSKPDESFAVNSLLIGHAQSDSGHAANNDLQDHLRSSSSPFQVTSALPGSTGIADVNHSVNLRRPSHSHYPQFSSPLGQHSQLYNLHNLNHYPLLPLAQDDGTQYDDGEFHSAYPQNLQTQNHHFNNNMYGSYGGSSTNPMSRRRSQPFVVPSNDNEIARANMRNNMTIEPMLEIGPNHPATKPNFSASSRSYTESSAPFMYRGRLPQATSHYLSPLQQQNPYQQASSAGRSATYHQPENFNDEEGVEDAEYATSSGWEQPTYRHTQQSGYQLAEPTAGQGLLYKDLKAVKAERKAITRRDIDDESFPTTTADQRRYVKRMLDAMNDMRIADDNVKMQGIWAKQKKNQRDVELSCWQLLELCMKAQLQEEHLEPKATPKPINTYTTFEHRVSEICKTLQQSKTICKHMLMPHYTATFVDDPEAAFSRVRNNRNVNNKKRIYLQQAKTVAQQKKEDEAARQGNQEWTEEDAAEEAYDYLRDFEHKQTPAPRPKPKKAAKKRKVEDDDDDDDAPFRGTPVPTRKRRNTSMYQLAPLENGGAQIVDTTDSPLNRRRTRRATTGGENLSTPDYTVDMEDDEEYFAHHFQSQNIGYHPFGEYSANYLDLQGFNEPQEVQPRNRSRR